jgi:Fe-S-cluster-containing hydrogenase component 2
MIKIDISKCTGCRKCETACAFYHSGKINHQLARMKVLNLYEIGVDGPVACIQCKEQYCLCCPDDAIGIGSLGQLIVSPTACTLCTACEKACPIGAIDIFDDFVYVCDLCGGKPRCVEVCTEGVLSFDSGEKEHLSLAVYKKETKKMNPSQKRQHYLKKTGAEIRKKWGRGNE